MIYTLTFSHCPDCRDPHAKCQPFAKVTARQAEGGPISLEVERLEHAIDLDDLDPISRAVIEQAEPLAQHDLAQLLDVRPDADLDLWSKVMCRRYCGTIFVSDVAVFIEASDMRDPEQEPS